MTTAHPAHQLHLRWTDLPSVGSHLPSVTTTYHPLDLYFAWFEVIFERLTVGKLPQRMVSGVQRMVGRRFRAPTLGISGHPVVAGGRRNGWLAHGADWPGGRGRSRRQREGR